MLAIGCACDLCRSGAPTAHLCKDESSGPTAIVPSLPPLTSPLLQAKTLDELKALLKGGWSDVEGFMVRCHASGAAQPETQLSPHAGVRDWLVL